MKAQIRGKHSQSPFRLQVNLTSRGVFFDRVVNNSHHRDREKMLVLHTSPRQARLLAKWILDHIPSED